MSIKLELLKWSALSWLILLVMTGCSSTPRVQTIVTPCPVLPPVPAAIMEERKPDFQERLQKLLSPSQQTPTKSPTN
jgi:hypothetical protein